MWSWSTRHRDRVGAPDVFLGMMEKAPQLTKLRADGGCAEPKLQDVLKGRDLGSLIEIVWKPKEIGD